MGAGVNNRRGETVAHARLKRLALLWAQAHDYSACALEVSLPQCRYRADVAAYRPRSNGLGSTAVFECKQALVDLRRDNCRTTVTRQRLENVQRRRQILEKHLRIHYPNLRIADSLFSEFESHDFAAIKHRGYGRVLRELTALQNRLFDCTKFETLMRYRCANLSSLFCLTSCPKPRRCRLAGVSSCNQMASSCSCASPPGRKARPIIASGSCSELPLLERER